MTTFLCETRSCEFSNAGAIRCSLPATVRGVRIFRSERPDLVITDIIMPEKEGLETIREIRGQRPDAKIIAISGGARIGNMDFLDIAGKLGASEIISKPFDPSDLIKLVSRCLGD